jgi:predicted membrane GTPase involved in stress response
MANETDLGSWTIKDVLKKKVADDAALKRILDEINAAYAKGIIGDELIAIFKEAMEKEGYDISTEQSGILYGFYIP